MSHEPLLKIAVLTATLVAHYYATTPPRPPPAPEEKVPSGVAQGFESAIPWIRVITGTFVSVSLASDVLVTATLVYPDLITFPPSASQALCPRPSPTFDSYLTHISPFFALGALLALAGGLLRVWCYRVLGELFTYEVAVRASHTLVQRGPYAFVRHPSYTAVVLHLAGIAFLLFEPGSWGRACGLTHIQSAGGCGVGVEVVTWGVWAWMGAVWALTAIYTSVGMWRRGAVEDAVLRARFGDVWDAYARAVPWRFIPGLP
ncbi:hypothetical protein BDW22DRAFT_1408152 [Trametopsis cervina]|nr:hypothetical protein BDW22DRAFT_1408152 [Trametopsis cervina]